jgi:thiamine kinase-like enzyme
LVNFKKIKPRLADRPTNVFDLYDKHYDHLMKNWPNQDFSALKEWNDYFKVSLKIFLKDNLYLAHADMNPGNIIYENNAINGLIDWELARYDGYWRDFANIYVASILFPAWQSEFLKELAIPENEIFQFNFYVIFYLALNISNFDFALKNKKNEIYRSGHLTHDEINHLLDVNLTALQKINLK